MARSAYIYVVFEHDDVIATFTVKHEMVTWLNREITPAARRSIRAMRYPDGHTYNEPSEIDTTELFQ